MKYFKYILSIFVTFVLFSCAKETIISDADFQKNLLAGTGNYQNTLHIWRLDSLTIASKPQVLTNVQKSYTKTFNRLGAYKDSDGYTGVWALSTGNKLDITTTNSANVKTKTTYDVVVLNAAQLQLKITGATGGEYNYFYVIAN
jgi:hypothetical protein